MTLQKKKKEKVYIYSQEYRRGHRNSERQLLWAQLLLFLSNIYSSRVV